MIGDRLKTGKDTFVAEVKQDVNDLIDVIMHRIQYGSPPLLAPTEDTGISPKISLAQKQKRIQRRRSLMGLPYEPWTGGTID